MLEFFKKQTKTLLFKGIKHKKMYMEGLNRKIKILRVADPLKILYKLEEVFGKFS